MKNKFSVHFTASRGWVPLIIRAMTRTEFNHTLISYEDYEGVTQYVDIGHPGVQKTESPDWRWVFRAVEFGIYDEGFDFAAAHRFIEENLGRKYDYLGILGFAWHILLSKFGIRTTNKIEDRSKYFCSEFVTWFLRKSGVRGFRNTRPRTTSPGKLFRLISANPKNFRII